jgi:ABC-2 type transport system permease protein
MIGAPGSLVWLARFELKLMQRDLARIRPAVAWLLLFVFLSMHVVGWLLLRHGVKIDLPPVFIALCASLALGFIFGLMVAKALTSCVQAIHGRRDLDLLLSAPVPARRIVTVRMATVSFGVALPFVFLVGPFLDALAFLGRPNYLAGYVVVFALALVATIIGLALSLALMRAVGPRRAETSAQIIGALFGAAAFLVAQARVLLPASWIHAALVWLGHQADAAAFHGADPLWMWPGWAAMGDSPRLLSVVAASILAFALGSLALAPAVAAWARASFGAPSKILAPSAPSRRGLAPRVGARRALFVKELRLLARHPLTIFHTLMKSLYLAPLALVALRAGDATLSAAAVSGLIVAISLQLGAALAGNTMRGEQAADLIAGAPMPAREVRTIKLAAALGPVILIAAAACLSVAQSAPRAAAIAFGFSLLASAVAGQLALWNEEPPRRADLRRRDSDLSPMAFVEVALTLCFGGVAFGAIRGDWWAALPAVIACLLFIAMSPRRERKPAAA